MRTTFHPGLHRFAVLTACATFFLLIAGALVTSNDAGLSIPDWPSNWGGIIPPLVGGIVYEFSHRAIATFVGCLTIVLAIWLWRAESRPWIRCLGLIALGAVVAQGVLGGVTVLFFQPVAASAGHAILAQIFFSTVVSLALFTSRWWQTEMPQREDPGSPRVRPLAAWTVAAIFLQLILGAVFRHKGSGIVPHLVGAAVVTGMIFWTAGALRRRFGDDPVFARCRRLLHALIGAQLFLGGAAWWSRIEAGASLQPAPVMVWLTVTHTVAGALTLAAAVIVTLVCYRILEPGREVDAVTQAHEIKEHAVL